MKLLITVPWDETQLTRVKQAFPSIDFKTALTEDEIVKAIPEADVVFGDISRSAFLRAKKLIWIQCHGAGVNKLVGIPELVESDVWVTNTSGAHASTIAEHFFGTLICLTRKLPELYAAQGKGEWINWNEWQVKIGKFPISLYGLTMGIVGFGNIGRAIAERAAAFKMNIIAVDIRMVEKPAYLTDLWEIQELPRIMSQSDVLVVTLPGTPQTKQLLGAEKLSLMKPSAYLSVVSRGGIVDEESLAKMLIEGRLAGATLDVFDTEPLSADSLLWKAPNFILTPHCSGKSEYTTTAATSIWIENLERFITRKPLMNVVDKKLGY